MSLPTIFLRNHPGRRNGVGFTLVELLVVVGLLVILLAVLLPSISRARKSAAIAKLEAVSREAQRAGANVDQGAGEPQSTAAAAGRQAATTTTFPPAHVKSFDADVSLTPRLSVGTAQPESIYEVNFTAKMDVKPASPDGIANPAGTPVKEHEVLVPLPPQIISLADLTVTMNGEPSDAVEIRGDRLAWHGRVDPLGPAALSVTYTAVGKGLYVLQTPPGKIIDRFRINLEAHGSDVRMMDLSLQPTTVGHSSGTTTYTWDYKRLMFGRPVALDVLGVAPIDRLGELYWLGPLSVVIFGLIVGLVANAWGVEAFDRWLLVLVLGTFAGAYPLMYFAQEFIPLRTAMLIAGGVVLTVIGLRTATVMGVRLAIFGVVIPAAVVMGLALTAAVRPPWQGMILTAMGLAVFALAMMLAPRLAAIRAHARRLIIPPTVEPEPALG
jgi:type II secretory pathway pseudopilin PulG